jgi:hypothetical protein
MRDLAFALVIIFCTPLGWIGMMCAGLALALVFHR